MLSFNSPRWVFVGFAILLVVFTPRVEAQTKPASSKMIENLLSNIRSGTADFKDIVNQSQSHRQNLPYLIEPNLAPSSALSLFTINAPVLCNIPEQERIQTRKQDEENGIIYGPGSRCPDEN